MYDIMHFEALGEEAEHLKEITEEFVKEGKLPEGFTSLITPLTLQDYLKEHKVDLPEIITTKTHSKLPEEYIETGVKKSVVTRSAGYDHFEHLQEKINLASLREYCVDAVAQTVVKFLYCTAGFLNEYTQNTAIFERQKTTSFMELTKDVVVAVYGVGKIGRQTYLDLVANGVTALAVDIREEELKQDEAYKDFIFVSPEEAMQRAHVLVNVMNLTKNKNSRFYNLGYFTPEYFAKATNPLIIINVTRGEIIPETAVLKLYEQGNLIGFASDVFTNEAELTERLRGKGFEDCTNQDVLAAKTIIDMALERKANFYVQPHQGFNSDLAANTKARETMNHISHWFNNENREFKEQLPYYK